MVVDNAIKWEYDRNPRRWARHQAHIEKAMQYGGKALDKAQKGLQKEQAEMKGKHPEQYAKCAKAYDNTNKQLHVAKEACDQAASEFAEKHPDSSDGLAKAYNNAAEEVRKCKEACNETMDDSKEHFPDKFDGAQPHPLDEGAQHVEDARKSIRASAVFEHEGETSDIRQIAQAQDDKKEDILESGADV